MLPVRRANEVAQEQMFPVRRGNEVAQEQVADRRALRFCSSIQNMK